MTENNCQRGSAENYFVFVADDSENNACCGGDSSNQSRIWLKTYSSTSRFSTFMLHIVFARFIDQL